jgi:hypothetical protein
MRCRNSGIKGLIRRCKKAPIGKIDGAKAAGHSFRREIIAIARPISGVAMPRRRNGCKNACEHTCKKPHMKACQRFARESAARLRQKRSTNRVHRAARNPYP